MNICSYAAELLKQDTFCSPKQFVGAHVIRTSQCNQDISMQSGHLTNKDIFQIREFHLTYTCTHMYLSQCVKVELSSLRVIVHGDPRPSPGSVHATCAHWSFWRGKTIVREGRTGVWTDVPLGRGGRGGRTDMEPHRVVVMSTSN